MKIFLSFLILLLANHTLACTMREGKTVISLSGTTTYLFRELGLLNQLKGISVFSPVSEKSFKGTVFPGGTFLSESVLQGMTGSIVFYDESIALRKTLSLKKQILSREIVTRNLLPLEAMDEAFSKMKDVLSHCDDKIRSITKVAREIQQKVIEKTPTRTILFYLGEIRNGRRPEMLMVNDGVVKLLIQERKLKTYPSDLGYVNWSSKLMSELPQDTLHVALHDPSMKELTEIKRSPMGVTFSYPGVLVPGLSQLRAFLYLFNSL